MSFETPDRFRINAKKTAKGYNIEATAEGKSFDFTVTTNQNDLAADGVKSSLGLKLAEMIIRTQKIFQEKGLPLADDFINLKETKKEK